MGCQATSQDCHLSFSYRETGSDGWGGHTASHTPTHTGWISVRKSVKTTDLEGGSVLGMLEAGRGRCDMNGVAGGGCEKQGVAGGERVRHVWCGWWCDSVCVCSEQNMAKDQPAD